MASERTAQHAARWHRHIGIPGGHCSVRDGSRTASSQVVVELGRLAARRRRIGDSAEFSCQGYLKGEALPLARGVPATELTEDERVTVIVPVDVAKGDENVMLARQHRAEQIGVVGLGLRAVAQP